MKVQGFVNLLRDNIERAPRDHEVLWENLKVQSLQDGRQIGAIVENLITEIPEISHDLTAIEQVPYLQVALVSGFDSWSADSSIIVAYTPLTINDVDVE